MQDKSDDKIQGTFSLGAKTKVGGRTAAETVLDRLRHHQPLLRDASSLICSLQVNYDCRTQLSMYVFRNPNSYPSRVDE